MLEAFDRTVCCFLALSLVSHWDSFSTDARPLSVASTSSLFSGVDCFEFEQTLFLDGVDDVLDGVEDLLISPSGHLSRPLIIALFLASSIPTLVRTMMCVNINNSSLLSALGSRQFFKKEL